MSQDEKNIPKQITEEGEEPDPIDNIFNNVIEFVLTSIIEESIVEAYPNKKNPGRFYESLEKKYPDLETKIQESLKEFCEYLNKLGEDFYSHADDAMEKCVQLLKSLV